jgi:tripartite-type tricarboxylate transporter receptor subunit TctC
MRELGLPKVNSDNWYALISPGQAPLAARQKILAAAVETLKSKEVTDAYAAVGGVVVGSTTQELQSFLAAESTKWAEVIKFANVKLE